MKDIIWISTFLVFSSLLLFSEKIDNESEFLKDVILKDYDSIIYVKESYNLKEIKEKLYKKRFNSLNDSNFIELNDVEYRYILNEIEENKNHVWASNLFPNSNIVPQDEIRIIFKIKE